MALGTPTDGGAAYSASGGTTVAPAYPAVSNAGDCLVLIIGQKPSTANGGTVTTPTGWTLRESLTGAGGYGATLGADTGNTNLFFYTKNVVDGTETGNLTVTIGTNNVSWGLIVNIPTGGGTLSYGSADGSRTTAPTSGVAFTTLLTNGASAPALQSGDIALWAMCIPTDVLANGFTVPTISSTGTTFGTAVELEEPDSGTGNDIGGYVAYALATAGTSSAAPTVGVTATGTVTNVRGPIALLRIREAALAPITGDLDATEVGSDTFLSTGDVVVKGDLDATEIGSDTFAATGTVTDVVITGSLAATEVGSDTLAATGDVIVKGSLAATEVGSDVFAATGEVADVVTTGTMAAVEVGSDTLAATGDVFVRGSLAASEVGSDTFAATGDTIVQGTLAATEVGTDTFAASGVVPVRGSLAASEVGSDTFAASGTVADPGIIGTFAATEVGSDTLASSGKVLVIGALAATEDPDVFAATGVVLVDGSFAAVEVGSDIFVGSGDNVVGGIMSATEVGSDTLGRYVDDGYVDVDYVDYEIPGQVLVQGALTASEVGSDIFAADGFTTTITGDLAATETGSDTFAATGTTEVAIAGRARGAIFTPVNEVTVLTKNHPRVRSSGNVGRVLTTSSAILVAAAHKPITGKSRKARIYRGVSVNAPLRGSKIQTTAVKVVTGTTFSIEPIKGAVGWSKDAKISTSTPTIIQFTRSKATLKSSQVKVTTVLNPTDQELMAMVMLLRNQKLEKMKKLGTK